MLDGGRIAAQGRHAELLQTSRLYRRMCARLSVGRALDEPAPITPSGHDAPAREPNWKERANPLVPTLPPRPVTQE